ncbi:MAG: 9-O-acetylesterase, partial [Muribaculaceae bacterium]|nr:9-O-acetylesterase [Muribaculaceae bacterium]
MAIAAVSVSVTAEVRLPQFLTDNMVVQQNSELIVSGEGKGGVKVSASWLDEPIVAEVSRGGKFKVFIPTPEAGGPWSISFFDNDGTKTLSDVWSGEVWLCSGQSNMEMPVGGWGKVKDYEKEISNATLPQVHLLQI